MDAVYELDALPELIDFADKLEAACIDTLNAGIMTKDLSGLVDAGVNVTTVNTRDFILAIKSRLEKSLCA